MSDTLTAAPPALQEPHAGSFPRRVMDTFFSPVALFSRFGARPPWVDVMLVSVVLGVIGLALIPQNVWMNTMEEAMRQRGQEVPAGMDPEAMARMQRMFGIGGGAIMPWIFLPIQAGIMVLLFNVILGGNATFRQYVSVIAHASLIGVVGQLVSLPIILQKGVMQGITLGALVGGMDRDSFVYQFLNAWNVFFVWQVVVLALGAAALNRRVSTGTAVGVLLALYAVVALIIAAI
ncbi:YIP1 family protein [Longimicrobium sp.]|uniref:YIP1 family protein n=1 Tax=Longimicrobium sp. TaxID=2029185 RepID=UPI003B3AA676